MMTSLSTTAVQVNRQLQEVAAARCISTRANSAHRKPSLSAEAVDASRWNSILQGFNDSSFEQTATFAAGRWGEDRTSHVVVMRRGEPIGGACVVTFALRFAPGGVSYVKHGPVWRRRHEEPRPENYHAILSALIAEYGERRGQGIVVVPRPHPATATIEQEMLEEHGFAVRRPNTDPNRFLVNLTLSEKDQFQSLGQKWRYNLRAALKNGIEVVEAAEDDAIADFTRLYSGMVARKRFAEHDPTELIPTMLAELPATLRPRVFLAQHQDVPVAGAVIGMHGDTAYYLFGASNEHGLELNAGYALQWSIVDCLRSESACWYDLGGEAGEHGLRQFKKGLVGKRGAVIAMKGEYEYARGFSAQSSISAIMTVRGLRRALLGRLACLLA